MVIIKEDLKTYSILFVIDHKIFDAPSKQILEYTFNKHYSKLVNNILVEEKLNKIYLIRHISTK